MTNSKARKRNKAHRRDRVRRGIRIGMMHQANVIQNRLQNTTGDSENSFDSEALVDSEPASHKLRSWAITHNITRNALSDLLKILISLGFSWLPSDARTLLETPRHTEIVNIANGQLWYNGIEQSLRRIFAKTNRDLKLILNFNVDGIPLFDSAKKEFWPILANFHSKQEI